MLKWIVKFQVSQQTDFYVKHTPVIQSSTLTCGDNYKGKTNKMIPRQNEKYLNKLECTPIDHSISSDHHCDKHSTLRHLDHVLLFNHFSQSANQSWLQFPGPWQSANWALLVDDGEKSIDHLITSNCDWVEWLEACLVKLPGFIIACWRVVRVLVLESIIAGGTDDPWSFTMNPNSPSITSLPNHYILIKGSRVLKPFTDQLKFPLNLFS